MRKPYVRPSGRALAGLIACILLPACEREWMLRIEPSVMQIFGGEIRAFDITYRPQFGVWAKANDGRGVFPVGKGGPTDCVTLLGASASGRASVTTNATGYGIIRVRGKPDLETTCSARVEFGNFEFPLTPLVARPVVVHPRKITEIFDGDPRRGSVTVWPEAAHPEHWLWLLTTLNDAKIRRIEVILPEDISACDVSIAAEGRQRHLRRSPRRLRPEVRRPDEKRIVVDVTAGTPPGDGWSRISIELECSREVGFESKLETSFRITPVTGQPLVIAGLPGPKRP